MQLKSFLSWIVLLSIGAVSLYLQAPKTQITASADWMDSTVQEELAPFAKKGISKKLLDTTWEACKKHPEFKRFQIIDSVVYGDECKMKRFLETLVKTHPTPNVDFIYFNEDRIKPSFFQRKEHRNSAPILVSAKHKNLRSSVLFSDWVYDITDHQKGWNFFIALAKQYEHISWEEKIPKAFWRGTPWDGKHFGMYTFENWTSLPRGQLVHQSLLYPDLIDARFSEYPLQCQSSISRCQREMGEICFTPWEEVFRFKYHIAIDGVTCSFPATQWKLLSGGLTFKQESDDIMYFYKELRAWEHYIPIKNDLSDLIEKIQWAKNHDEECKKIGENGKHFVQTHLMPEHILLYAHKFLVHYASLYRE